MKYHTEPQTWMNSFKKGPKDRKTDMTTYEQVTTEILIVRIITIYTNTFYYVYAFHFVPFTVIIISILLLTTAHHIFFSVNTYNI
jgi:hypothetical protein